MATTYNNLYLDIRQQLRRAGIEEATLEARELVCFGTNKSREELARDGGLYASPELEHRVRDLVRRHLEGEPVAYLIGEWEFYGLPLDISRDVLIPRPDTEVLAEQAIGYIKTLGECRVLDLCAGSGCIGLAVAAQVPQARVVLGEWSDGALKICRQNVRRNSLTARVVPMQADAREKPEKSLGEFQCIVSNPPYIPRADIETLDTSVKDYEPHLALDGGEDGLDFYRSISEKWKEALAPGGRLYFEVGIGHADNADHADPGLRGYPGGEGPPRHPPGGIRNAVYRALTFRERNGNGGAAVLCAGGGKSDPAVGRAPGVGLDADAPGFR